MTHDLSRRRWLWNLGGGLGGVALAQMLGSDGLLADAPDPKAQADLHGGLHHRARARRVVQLFMSGAASQCDMFDYKPLLIAKRGAPFDPGGKVELFQSQPGTVMPSPWSWSRHGGCGKWMSALVPHLAACVDDIAFLPAMVSKSNVHGPATFLQTTGFVAPGSPSAGAWVSYGLGSMNRDLPTFVVLPDARGYAPNGPANWGAGFLPAQNQATMIRPAAPNPVRDLFPPQADFLTDQAETEGRAILESLNHAHLGRHPGDSRLEARIASYELAARLQRSAPEVLDLTRESAATKRLYGLDQTAAADFGRNCLIARRLLERDVRFVQVWSGADNGFPRRNWDSHEDIARDHGEMGRGLDRPAAALIQDLKSRGLLDDTIVLWTTEFGRMPTHQEGTSGRDHNPDGFTCWMMGAGIKGGVSYGATDDFGRRSVQDVASAHDFYATVLHLLGLDHERLTYYHNGANRRLTDVHGHVLLPILA